MANNRMAIRCKNCGETFLFAKTYRDGYYLSNNIKKETFYDELNDYLFEHRYCNKEKTKDPTQFYEPKFKKRDYNEENSFELCYETYYRKGE